MKTAKILMSIAISFSISTCFNAFSMEKDNIADTVKINNILTLKPTDNKSFLVAINDNEPEKEPVCRLCGTRDHSEENCDEDSDVTFELSDDENNSNASSGYLELEESSNGYDRSDDLSDLEDDTPERRATM